MANRIKFIDYWRGIAVYGMIVYHLIFDIEFMFGFTDFLLGNVYYEAFFNIFRLSFVFLVGISAYLVNKSTSGSKKPFMPQLKRFLYIFGSALLIMVATYIADKDIFIFWGVLHLFSLAAVYFMLARNNYFVHMVVAGVLLGLSFVNFDSNLLLVQIFGFADLTRSTLDFFPIYPWLLLILAGNIFAPILLRKLNFLDKYITDNSFTCMVGRKSLIIYLVHQPILILILWLLHKIILSV